MALRELASALPGQYLHVRELSHTMQSADGVKIHPGVSSLFQNCYVHTTGFSL